MISVNTFAISFVKVKIKHNIKIITIVINNDNIFVIRDLIKTFRLPNMYKQKLKNKDNIRTDIENNTIKIIIDKVNLFINISPL